ncbi:MAG: AraC family transcriptional regulator ligand-binding domain-containing protein [Alphaproteobacteria bacterium]|nr:AraC family transcriptional regulator ligand-binding domain-containing protein [Alphaproteobacteria bacterium]
MTSGSTISSTVLTGFDDELAARGLDAFALGRDCDIPEHVWLCGDDEVPLASFVKLLQHGASVSGDQAFGWDAGPGFDLLSLGALGEAVLAAPNLGSALLTFSTYLRLVQSTSELRFDVEDDEAVVTYRILDPDIWPRQQDAEFSLSIFVSLIQSCLGADWRPTVIDFEHEPTRREQSWHHAVGPCCRFGQASNAVVLPAGALDQKMPARDNRIWQQRSAALRRAMRDRNDHRAIAHRVASAVLAALGRGPVDQGHIAASLGLSCRSLHRKLEAEGTGFADILQDCRARLARHRLAHGDQALSHVALELGYSDQTAFARAFKRRSGMTPGEYRQRHGGADHPPTALLGLKQERQ